MKAWNKFLSLFLTLIMVLALAVPAGAVESEKDLTGYTVILHTNDVHGAIDGYASVTALKEQYTAAGASVYLVDVGDFSQGDPAVSLSQGKNAIDLMNLARYDLAVPGNHEFDYGFDNLKDLQNQAWPGFLAANVLYDSNPAFTPNRICTTPAGVKVGFFGLATPETATKAHPAKIQGLTFLGGQEMYDCAQAQVELLKAEGCDVIVCLGHLGIDPGSAPNRSIDLLEHVDGIDLFIDGHSHSTLADVQSVTNESATVNGALLTSTGSKLKNIGVVEIAPDGTMEALNLDTAQLQTQEGFTPDAATAQWAAGIQAEIDAQYGVPFATTQVTLQGETLQVRTGETNLGDLIADAMVWQANLLGEPIDGAILNGGGIRATILAGEITRRDIQTVLPFGNTLYMVKVTGADLLEALEASTYCTPDPTGAFPQVSGITFTLNTGAPFSAQENYPSSTYQKPDAINRVTIHTVGGQLFDPKETYTIVTNDYLGAGGDSYYSFTDSPVGYDLGLPLDEVVIDYITSQLKGVVAESDYGQAQGRIATISYRDVKASDWFINPVIFVTRSGLMQGSDGAFYPNDNLTRAMMVTVLYRMAGQPEVSAPPVFLDVDDNAWYADAVAWAYEENITKGTDTLHFSPDQPLTREQLATFFYRFADYERFDEIVVEGDNLTDFTDGNQVSDFARTAMNWAIAEGLITGMGDNTLAPQGTATRAQVATILMRYVSE
ncbi:MAG: 5'-nucleotidase C-terminal domain-containing protein [Bacillota bacterium]|nr:5'-nucleotidase C-terminal domain-containing protein [Bacillota bacterium]